MSEVGTVIKGKEVGKKDDCYYIWHACVDCGKERWVQYPKRKVRSVRCNRCRNILTAKTRDKSYHHRGAGNSNWKGGKLGKAGGYIQVWLDANSSYFPMASANGYVMEHRLIIAEHLGRCLTRNEQVHHMNGIKSDNRRENLQLFSQADHHTFTRMCAQCELRKEIRLLGWQIKQQSDQIRELTKQLMGL